MNKIKKAKELSLAARLLRATEQIERSINRHEAASILGVSVRTLQRWHAKGYGPPRKASRGKWVSYKRAEVEDWARAVDCKQADIPGY